MVKKIALFALFVALFIGFWNLCDLLWATFITGSGYQFTLKEDLLYPLGLLLIFGCVNLFTAKKK